MIEAKNPGPKPSRARHRTVDRITEILETAARASDGVTLSEIARELDAPVSSVQGLVNGLVAAGYLDGQDRRYTLGSATYLLNRIAGREPVTAVSHADLAAIRDRTGVTSVLAIAVGDRNFYVDYASSDPRFAYLAENYVRRSLIRTSTGWVLLAGMERRDLWAYIQALPVEDQPLIDKFLAAMPQIVETGICVAPGVSADGEGIAIAVREKERTVAAVGVISTAEVIAEKFDQIMHTLQEHSTRWALGTP